MIKGIARKFTAAMMVAAMMNGTAFGEGLPEEIPAAETEPAFVISEPIVILEAMPVPEPEPVVMPEPVQAEEAIPAEEAASEIPAPVEEATPEIPAPAEEAVPEEAISPVTEEAEAEEAPAVSDGAEEAEQPAEDEAAQEETEEAEPVIPVIEGTLPGTAELPEEETAGEQPAEEETPAEEIPEEIVIDLMTVLQSGESVYVFTAGSETAVYQDSALREKIGTIRGGAMLLADGGLDFRADGGCSVKVFAAVNGTPVEGYVNYSALNSLNYMTSIPAGGDANVNGRPVFNITLIAAAKPVREEIPEEIPAEIPEEVPAAEEETPAAAEEVPAVESPEAEGGEAGETIPEIGIPEAVTGEEAAEEPSEEAPEEGDGVTEKPVSPQASIVLLLAEGQTYLNEGDEVSMMAVADGEILGELEYHWQYSDDLGETWIDIPDSNVQILTVVVHADESARLWRVGTRYQVEEAEEQ